MPANTQGGNHTDVMQNFNTEDMQRVLEIIGVVGDDDFTEEQLTELRALGISETQISMLRSMAQGGRGGNMQNGMNRQTDTQIPANPQDQQNPLTSGFGREAWLLLGVCALSLFGGLLFVVFSSSADPQNRNLQLSSRNGRFEFPIPNPPFSSKNAHLLNIDVNFLKTER